MLLYFSALVFVYCFALASPILYRYFEIGSAGGAGPEQQAQLTEAMREVLRGRLWIAGLARRRLSGSGRGCCRGCARPASRRSQAKRAASRRRAKP